MTSQPENSGTFAEFLQLWKNNSGDSELRDYSHYIKSNPLIDNVLSLGPCFVYMLDYRTMKYLYLSPSLVNILGYDPKDILDKGPAFFHGKIHPEDFSELMNVYFKKILDFYYNIPIDNRKKLRCVYDYRIKRSDGKYVRLLQQTVVVEIDENGNPLVDIGIVSDISEYKKDNQITLSLSLYDQEIGFVSKKQESLIREKPDRISERELEILKLLMQGYSSKKIADELNISINTVRNHRQNLLEKTKTKNIAELISFALSNSLI